MAQSGDKHSYDGQSSSSEDESRKKTSSTSISGLPRSYSNQEPQSSSSNNNSPVKKNENKDGKRSEEKRQSSSPSGRRRKRDRSRRSRSGSRRRRRRSRSSSRSPKRNRKSSKEPRKSSGDQRRRGSRSRSRERRRRSRSRDRKWSRSDKSRGHRSRSREGGRRRSKSRDRHRRRSRSRSRRDRSDSGSPPSFRGGFNTALDAQERLARRLERAKKLTKLKKEEEQKRANGFLGLKDDRLKEAIENAAKMIAGSGPITSPPLEAMSAKASAQMNALRKQAEKETGISVPTYYNPLVVNPMMFAQQQAKRNKLWSKKDSDTAKKETADPNSSLWSKTTLGNEKANEKFAKLMGIKQLDATGNPPSDEITKRQELFSNLDQQYQQARVVTHTQRGAGLGFASNNPNTLLAQQANQQLNPSTTVPPKS